MAPLFRQPWGNSRWLVLGMLGLLASVACDEDKHPTEHDDLTSRGQAIVAKPQAAEAPALTPAAHPSDSAAAKPRVFCSSTSPSKGLKLPDTVLVQRNAGATSLDEEIHAGHGEWTWLNLWAAWCVPCKQEIPLLLSWERKLATAATPLKVVFVSLDDDERQLQDFLHDQPADGLKSSYWLREGHERADWLTALKVDPDPRLPGHFLVDPQGEVRCYISGAIEPRDFGPLQRIIRR